MKRRNEVKAEANAPAAIPVRRRVSILKLPFPFQPELGSYSLSGFGGSERPCR
jgi:hypothetical protein